MSNSSEIRVLNAFVPFLRLLTAFNCNHFRHKNWRSIVRSVFDAFGATVTVTANFAWIILITWYLFETEAELKKFVVAIPMLVTLLQIELTFIALMMKHHTITETVDQLHRMINRSEFFFQSPLFRDLLHEPL